MNSEYCCERAPVPFSLKQRLFSRLVCMCLLSAGVLAFADIWIIIHLNEQAPGREGHSFSAEVAHTLPLLLVPQIAVLVFAFFWLYRLVLRSIIIPVLSVAGKIGGIRGGRMDRIAPPEPVAEEIMAIYDAVNGHITSIRADMDGAEVKAAGTGE